MAIQCQYDIEAHLDHIITFLLHPLKFVSIISFCLFKPVASETGEIKIAATKSVT